MAKAGGKGILLRDYLKLHAEPHVRRQLDCGELRYEWIDCNDNARASDDGGVLPPKGWWLNLHGTTIDPETSEVRGDARFGSPPMFRRLFRVRVFPTVERSAQKTPSRGRPSSAPLVIEEAKDRLQGSHRAEIERRGLENFREELKVWLGKAHPEAKPMAAKTIGDHLRKDESIHTLWPKSWRRRRR